MPSTCSPVIERQAEKIQPLGQCRRFKSHKTVAVCLFLIECPSNHVLFAAGFGFHFDEDFGCKESDATAAELGGHGSACVWRVPPGYLAATVVPPVQGPQGGKAGHESQLPIDVTTHAVKPQNPTKTCAYWR